ncbi:ATP-binding cassette domain-containing protein [Micromonospora okii]|uniref:ATP-binding cassette domain-containing protein n=1 Tax=Micromonospora okii TaxID=1182970 RepID=UPI001E330B0B|nr:ATP-binding cassette domain-containing protein [Micromonospora okii]
MTQWGIEVEHLRKEFDGKPAVRDVSFTVGAGTLLGLLGPNGSGKTTIINCLTTVLTPDGGRLLVDGCDVTGAPEQVRARIAVTGQFAALDEVLSGRDNLMLFGRLLRLPKRQARQRADELLDRFALGDAADKPVKAYSGGMRRRLDLAASLVVPRPVVFLDEPTTGLDPRSREELWQTIRQLRDDGATILLTSQYLEEVDRLADRVVVIDAGRVIAEGTGDELKGRVGGQVCEVTVPEPNRAAAREALRAFSGEVAEHGEHLVVPVSRPAQLVEIVRLLDDRGIEIDDAALRKPTLDEVFFALTGRADETADGDERAADGDAGTTGRDGERPAGAVPAEGARS